MVKETHVSPSLQIGKLMLKEEDSFYCHIKARCDHEVTLQMTAAGLWLVGTCLSLAAISAPGFVKNMPNLWNLNLASYAGESVTLWGHESPGTDLGSRVSR